MEAIAKFKVGSITETVFGAEIKLNHVTEGSPENESFYKWTPGGGISLNTVNPAVAAMFRPGKEFYVEFEEAK